MAVVGKTSNASPPAPPETPPPDQPAPPPAEPPVVAPRSAELITPDSTHLNTDHVKPVEQPLQPTDSFAKAYVPPNPLPQQADWTWTVNGKDYMNVVVVQVKGEVVEITFDGGDTSFNLSDLPPDLKKVFNYDPELAAAVAKAKADAAAIQAEQTPPTNPSGK
jgi:hypothetical protein